MVKRKMLTPLKMIHILKELLNRQAYCLLATAGIPSNDPHAKSEQPEYCHQEHSTYTPTLGVMFRPLTNDLQIYEPGDAAWYPHYERATLHMSGGFDPIIVREHHHINAVRDVNPRRMAFGISFQFRYFNVQAELMPSGIQSLCDDPGGLVDKLCIRVKSERRTAKPPPIANKCLTDSKAGIARFKAWVIRTTTFLINQHVLTAAQHRKGIMRLMQNELRAEDQFNDTVKEIKRMYELRFPGRTLHHTFTDVVNKSGIFVSRTALKTGLPAYYEFQKVQAVFFCLDLKRQLWLIVQGGKKGSILSASNYIISTVSLRAHAGNLWSLRRVQALLDRGMYIPEEEPGFVKERPPRKQLVIVQSKSPAE